MRFACALLTLVPEPPSRKPRVPAALAGCKIASQYSWPEVTVTVNGALFQAPAVGELIVAKPRS